MDYLIFLLIINYLFYRFPLGNPELLKQWLQAMKRKQFTPSKYSKY